MKSSTLVFLHLFGLAVCGVIDARKSDGSTNIIGGQDAKLDEFPFLVSLQVEDKHLCGGTVINEYFVLTSARCCIDLRPFVDFVVAGGVKLYEDEGVEQRIMLSDVIKHPQFALFENEICLLKLVSPLNLKTSHVKPVKLPDRMQETPAGTIATVAGFGETSIATDKDHVHKVNVPVISDESCRAMYSEELIPSSSICAGYDQDGKGFCRGDFGSPLIDASSKVLLGIATWSKLCALAEYPGVYTEVSHYIDWIASTIAEN